MTTWNPASAEIPGGTQRIWVEQFMKICTVPDCTKPTTARGLCRMHYNRMLTTGSTGDPRPGPKVCEADGCEARQAARGLCDTHYRRLMKYGSTDTPERQKRGPKPGSRRARAAEFKETRRCAACTGPFPLDVHGRSAYCSEECRKNAWKVIQRGADLKRLYGITLADYEAMRMAQGNRCAICRTGDPGRKGDWCVDHCHKTGKVRGLLCSECNNGLGKFKDDPELLESALAYLRSHIE